MNTFFISDLHLQPAREDLALALKGFAAKELHAGDTLYILGDFFDAWIGDDEDHPFYLDIKNALRSWVEKKVNIFFMHGNRDFLIKEKFAEETGVQLIDDPAQLELAGKKLLLMHGDSLCTQDLEYMSFRQQVRSPQWQQQVLALPLEQRRAMAADLRSKSKSMSSNKADDIMDVTPAEVEKVLQENRADILLHGHTHRPGRHNIDIAGLPHERIVLGDWDHQGWYVKGNSRALELFSFDICS